MGIGFSGGLSIVAAGRPRCDRVRLRRSSFGGHDDLPRVLQYLCTGRSRGRRNRAQAAGRRDARRSHGLRAAAARLRRRSACSSACAIASCRPAQVEPLRDGDPPRCSSALATDGLRQGTSAAPSSSRCAQSANRLPEPSATLLRYVLRPRRRSPRRQAAAARRPTAAMPRCRHRVARSRRRRCSCSTAPTTTSSRRWSPSISPRSFAVTRRSAC